MGRATGKARELERQGTADEVLASGLSVQVGRAEEAGDPGGDCRLVCLQPRSRPRGWPHFAFSLAMASRALKVDIVDRKENEMSFVLSGVHDSVANALRRVMIAEVRPAQGRREGRALGRGVAAAQRARPPVKPGALGAHEPTI